MADFGNGPYAWLREPNDARPLVGACIADAVCGFPEEYGISESLHKKFAEWVIEFENKYKKQDVDWERWNQFGIELTQRLKQEVGDRFFVEYHFPYEDPRCQTEPEIVEIE